MLVRASRICQSKNTQIKRYSPPSLEGVCVFVGGVCDPNVPKGEGEGGDIECACGVGAGGGTGARVECCQSVMIDVKEFEVTIPGQ
jgi:hypothetical protein